MTLAGVASHDLFCLFASKYQSTMKTQTILPEGIELTDTQSKMNWERIASGEMTDGLLILEGPKASGKTRLAMQIIGDGRPMMLPNEKSLDYIFSVEKRKLAFFDEVRTTKASGNEGRGRKVVDAPLDSGAIASAVLTGALVILAGECVLLSPALERLAIRISLGQNA